MAKSDNTKKPTGAARVPYMLDAGDAKSLPEAVANYLYGLDPKALTAEERSHLWNAAALFASKCGGRRPESNVTEVRRGKAKTD